MPKALEILKTYWKYTAFKHPQETIINHIREENNVIALLPTGSGKSLCYQVPAMMSPGVCLVVSPLIALMNDQVASLIAKGIKALAITSANSQEEVINAFDNLKYGGYKFLYLSPEKLCTELIRQKIQELDINLLAVDEAHCISEWGHDFRPAYLKIAEIRELFPDIPVIALTATATPQVIKDIKDNLRIPDAHVITKSLLRDNLSLTFVNTEDIVHFLTRQLRDIQGVSIIYASSRKKTVELSQLLNNQGIKCSFYHGGMSHEEKKQAYTDWMTEKTPVIVATNAFGMGIDKDNVRVIIHVDLPFSLENYMQETGRAGRDGEKAYSYLINNANSLNLLKKFYKKSKLERTLVQKTYTDLYKEFQISPGELSKQLFDFNLQDFCTRYNHKRESAYNILKFLEN